MPEQGEQLSAIGSRRGGQGTNPPQMTVAGEPTSRHGKPHPSRTQASTVETTPSDLHEEVSQVAVSLGALFAMVAICFLAARGDTAPIPAVALFGGAVFASGTIVNVSIHIRR
ncbi:hypothetical protein [Streptomyces collinus]|uniref:hypothetical protein n=1 Tax=Streptomyces collinus TaxID=42684 RepID=UPI003800AFB8